MVGFQSKDLRLTLPASRSEHTKKVMFKIALHKLNRARRMNILNHGLLFKYFALVSFKKEG